MILYMEGNISYAIGIDVGLNSVGLAAIRLDNNGEPIRILKAMSVIHDAGIDPNGAKESDTRKAISGVARRVRRLCIVSADVVCRNLIFYCIHWVFLLLKTRI